VKPVLEIDKRVGRPQLFLQLLPRDELAGIPQENRQHLYRTPLHRQPDSAAAQFPRPEVQFESAEPDDLVGLL
jgi:hypothetical protein